MRTLVISDLHAPFTHPSAIDFLADLKRAIKPDIVVCVGDEIDAHGWGRWDRNPDAPGQGDELAAAKGMLRPIFKLFPKVQVCNSNHSQRSFKKAARAGLPSAFVRTLREVLDAPQTWTWADAHEVDGVMFVHGEGFNGVRSALDAASTYRRKTVIGHVHGHAGISYTDNGLERIWGMNVGCLVDPQALAFEYTKPHRAKPVLGAGVVIDGVPHFYPLEEV